jgi:hypothetical protein
MIRFTRSGVLENSGAKYGFECEECHYTCGVASHFVEHLTLKPVHRFKVDKAVVDVIRNITVVETGGSVFPR